jgi:hypothetical protein
MILANFILVASSMLFVFYLGATARIIVDRRR